MSFDFQNANKEQIEAIKTTEGPLLIIAGPGTGKTFTLVKRIVYLITQKNVSPEEIMVATFTEKAAKELITRVSNELLSIGISININEIYIGTFHSICLRIMEEYQEENRYKLLDAFEQVYIVYEYIEYFRKIKGFKNHIPDSLGSWKQALKVINYANTLMEEIVDLDLMEKDIDEDMRFIATLVKRYLGLLDKHKAIDFASIQRNTYYLLKDNQNILDNIREKIKYIMVDEYQDTNYIQEQILLLLLSSERKNLCVVGDDDQGMYRFRGATIRNILEFPMHFKENECKQVHLYTNYRSEKGIIDFYNNWMENVEGLNLFNWNKYRFDKNIIPGKCNYRTDDTVLRCSANSSEEWRSEVLALINKLQKEGNVSNLNQIAFLFRSVKGDEARELANYLESNNIHVYSPRSEMFFERTEVKQIIGCLLFCFKSYISDLKNNTFNKPVIKDLHEYYRSCLREAKLLIQNNQEIKNYIGIKQRELIAINEDDNLGLLDLYYKLISFEPFKGYIEVDIKEGIYQTRSARNLAKISEIISSFNALHDITNLTNYNEYDVSCQFFNIYLKCLYIDGVGETEDSEEYAPSGCVSFLTFHQSKGLEFPIVIVNSLKNSPKKDFDSLMYTVESRFFKRGTFEPLNDIKFFDFWRLYYTAFSRAQNLLILSGTDEVDGKNKPSKYFENYFNKLPDALQKDFTDFEFETIKEVNTKNTYSFTSHIQLYNNCSLQYKYFKEYGFVSNKKLATTVGSLVHAILEDINKRVIKDKVKNISDENIEEIFKYNYEIMIEQTKTKLTDEQVESALDQVKRYTKYQEDKWQKLLKAEEEINIVHSDYIIKGIVDLIIINDNGLEIIDFKTGPKPEIDKNPHYVDDYKKQLEVYAYLIESRYKKVVDKMNLHYTNVKEGLPIITFYRDENSIKKTIRNVEETINNIENKNFNKKSQRRYICTNCDMKYLCNRE